MSREAVFVPEKKKKIENIKSKYNNMSMSDSAASKIVSLEVTNNILKAATAAAGVITVIDFFVPDPVLGLDEAALTAITGVLGYASKMVDNKIDAIVESGNASLEMNEITKLTEQVSNAAKSIKSSRSK